MCFYPEVASVSVTLGKTGAELMGAGSAGGGSREEPTRQRVQESESDRRLIGIGKDAQPH